MSVLAFVWRTRTDYEQGGGVDTAAYDTAIHNAAAQQQSGGHAAAQQQPGGHLTLVRYSHGALVKG